jgi:hypothetical protein
MRKLASGLRKQLLRKLKEKNPDLELGKSQKDLRFASITATD